MENIDAAYRRAIKAVEALTAERDAMAAENEELRKGIKIILTSLLDTAGRDVVISKASWLAFKEIILPYFKCDGESETALTAGGDDV